MAAPASRRRRPVPRRHATTPRPCQDMVGNRGGTSSQPASSGGGQVIIAGGSTPAGASDAVLRFDPATGRVSRIGRLPAPTTHAAAATNGGFVYVVGGRGDDVSEQRAAVLSIDPPTGRSGRGAGCRCRSQTPRSYRSATGGWSLEGCHRLALRPPWANSARPPDTVLSLHREDVGHNCVAVSPSQRMRNRHLGRELHEDRAWHPQAAQVAALLTCRLAPQQ